MNLLRYRRMAFLFPFFLCSLPTLAQKKAAPLPAKPKLVVGIVVDQMRYDYLYRYYDQYTGGLKRMMTQGFNAKNTQYNYYPTYTAPGHSSVYTGSTPAVTGIAGNDWYDVNLGKTMYCTGDSTVQTVGGSPTNDDGKMSPRNLLVSTITDQLRLSTNFRSKVIGVAIKDRGSILPAGHTGTAYWFNSHEGTWITSTYYMPDLPQWVKDFNAQKRPDQYITQEWKPLLPLAQYTQSTADEQVWEGKFPTDQKSVFPHNMTGSKTEKYSQIAPSPFGNTMTKDFAIAAARNEQLGKGKDTDFLAISFSSTDYVGHSFGPNSIETQDVYLHLDKDLGELFTFLDGWVGKDNYLAFLTADHGAVDVPEFSASHGLPGSRLSLPKARTDVNAALKAAFGDGTFIRHEINNQYYLNHALLKQKNVTIAQIYDVIKETLMPKNGISTVVNLHDLANAPLDPYHVSLLKFGWNPKRSGDIFVGTDPGWLTGNSPGTGTSHGTYFRYDTHVPCLWYGWRVPVGFTVAPTTISDIAPTVAFLLDILEPGGTVGEPIQKLVEGLK